MSESFVGEIRMFGFNFAPVGWAACDGSLMAIAQNDALFALIGTTYGGDGQVTFGLPNLQGRVPINMGQGPGLGNVAIGELGGVPSVTLTNAQLPSHSHLVTGGLGKRDAISPEGAFLVPGDIYGGVAPDADFSAQAVSPAGGNQAHENMQPSLTINFCISLFGIFPAQN